MGVLTICCSQSCSQVVKMTKFSSRKEFEQYMKYRKCINCRYYEPNHNLEFSKAKAYVLQYLKKELNENIDDQGQLKTTLNELKSKIEHIKSYDELRDFITKYSKCYVRFLIANIFNLGAYCTKRKACIESVKKTNFAFDCEYFCGKVGVTIT